MHQYTDYDLISFSKNDVLCYIFYYMVYFYSFPRYTEDYFITCSLRRELKKFCVTDPFSTKIWQVDLNPKQLHSSGYNLPFDIIAIPSNAFLMDEFVNACSTQCRVFLFKKLVTAFFRLSSSWNYCFPEELCRPKNGWKLEHTRSGD